MTHFHTRDDMEYTAKDVLKFVLLVTTGTHDLALEEVQPHAFHDEAQVNEYLSHVGPGNDWALYEMTPRGLELKRSMADELATRLRGSKSKRRRP